MLYVVCVESVWQLRVDRSRWWSWSVVTCWNTLIYSDTLVLTLGIHCRSVRAACISNDINFSLSVPSVLNHLASCLVLLFYVLHMIFSFSDIAPSSDLLLVSFFHPSPSVISCWHLLFDSSSSWSTSFTMIFWYSLMSTLAPIVITTCWERESWVLTDLDQIALITIIIQHCWLLQILQSLS